jgi:hypothetical protein
LVVGGITEGNDEAVVDGVVFVDPKSSVIEIMPAVGGAFTRDPADPRKRALIVMAIFVGADDAPERQVAAQQPDGAQRRGRHVSSAPSVRPRDGRVPEGFAD